MKIVGKYSFVKKDKKNNIISKEQQYNTITNLGQKQILDLLQYATPTNNFKGMIGYDVLDLSKYKIKPVFSNGSTKIVHQNYINQLVSDDYSDQNPTFDKWGNKEWTVQSSFFFDKKWGGNTFKLNKVFSTEYNNDQDYSFSWRAIIKNDLFSEQNVDAILKKDHQTYVNWSGHYNSSRSTGRALFYQNLQNIDFFRVYCRQRVIVYKTQQQIDLWRGRLQGQPQANELKVVYKKDLSQSSYNSTNFCFRAKYRKFGSTGQFTYFNNSTDVVINDIKGTVCLTNSVFPSIKNQQKAIEVILQYYVHYKDQQLKNGICGMYLDYDFVTKNNNNIFSRRAFFGNGIFSADGGKSWDNYMCFPWAGIPKTYGGYYSFQYNNSKDTWFYGNIGTPSLLTTSQRQDGINEHYYSFYPYVYKNPTNFCFLTFFNNQKIRIKNFLFLIPKFKPQVPRAFVFGDGNSHQQSQEDLNLQNQRLKLDATQCQTTSQDGIIKWKTFLDFEQANDFIINEVGIAFGNQNLKQVKGNWYCLKNIVKQDCNSLFSRVRLQTPIQKTDQQALQVTYELVVS